MNSLLSPFARLLVALVVFASAAFGNYGTLDTTFNGVGYRLDPVGPGDAGAYSIAIQSDGKLVVGGMTRLSENDKFAIRRLNADGSPDLSFGTNGIAFSPDGIQAVAWDPKVLIQPDGKILLGTTSYFTDRQSYAFTVFRFTSEGVLDTTFNNTGYASANLPNSLWDLCNSMALAPDGKIYLFGRSLITGGQPEDWDLSLARFHPNGSLDTSFDGDGVARLADAASDEEAFSLLVESDGKAVIGGRDIRNVNWYLLTRINTDGSLDTSFGTNGRTLFVIDSLNNNLTSLARQSDGKILGGGGGKIVRFSANGIRDMSFGRQGYQGDTGTIEHLDIKVVAGDKFYVGTRYGVRRYMPDGGVDTHFRPSFFLQNANCYMRSVAIQNDGKPVVAGVCRDNTLTQRFAVARFREERTRRFLDFNGDERTDISIYRPSNGQWWYLDSPNSSLQRVAGQFGSPTDLPVPADFSGDGKADAAVWRPSSGEWFILRSESGTYYSFPFGMSGDVPFTADLDGDQLADAGIFRPSTNEWFIKLTTGGVFYTVFGTAGDRIVPSDYDGDFITDIAIYRPSNGEWWVRKSSDGGIYAFQFGTSTDKPVQGDYTGDNKSDAAFYRPQSGEWFILRSEDSSYYALPFGIEEDIPTPGNFWGDARYDLVVYRPSTNRWHILPTGGSYFYNDFGSADDVPLSSVSTP